MARMAHVGGMKVRIPKGKSDLGPKDRTAISKLMSNSTVRKNAACTIVIAHKRGGGPVAFQRCTDRRLKATNRRQCRRGGSGPKAHLFTKCGAGKRRRKR